MAHHLDFHALPQGQISKLRKSEGVDGLIRRILDNGEHIGRIEFADVDPSELFDGIDHLLNIQLSDLLGCDVGDLDGGAFDPKCGYLSNDDMSDALEALDQLVEAIDLDPDEEDDEDFDRVRLFQIRGRAEELAEDLKLVFDDDFADLVNDLADFTRAARDEDGALITVHNGTHVSGD
jgi:hypothetical protein